MQSESPSSTSSSGSLLKSLGGKIHTSWRRWRDRIVRIARDVSQDYALDMGRQFTAEMGCLEKRIDERLQALRQELDVVRETANRQAVSIDLLVAALAESAGGEPVAENGPLVSIILPVRNGAATLPAALASIAAQSYTRWELVAVDDGSDDETAEILRAASVDSRIRVITQGARGHAAARNAALAESRGELIAYLDADNTWFPHYLASMVRRFLAEEDAPALFAAQWVTRENEPGGYVRGGPFEWESFRRRGGIDLNVYMHRRRLYEEFGGFDESLPRLVDWDLIGRYAAAGEPRDAAVLGGRYVEARLGSVTDQEYYGPSAYRVRWRQEPRRGEGLRVLYMAGDYPNLSETYVRWEIACMRRWGVEVEVWSEAEKPGSPFPALERIHHGDPREAIHSFRPHVLHFHWMHLAEKNLAIVEESGLPMTVRAHSFEFGPELLKRLAEHPAQRGVFAFPHLAEGEQPKAVIPMAVGLYGELYYPEAEYDRRLVLRVGAALPTKDLLRFIDAAVLCPEHRFVACLSVSTGDPGYVEEVREYNEKLGNPVDLRTRVPTEELAKLVRRAGIYIHTQGGAGYFGMPISIAESMACGAFVLARRLPGAAEFVGPAGWLYESTEEIAAAVQETLSWSEEQWARVRRTAVEWVFQRHSDIDIYRPLLECWQAAARTAGVRSGSNGILECRNQVEKSCVLPDRNIPLVGGS